MGGQVNAVPPTDHISRYCEKRYLDGDRITGAAFRLRQAIATRKEETYLSVNWLEFLKCGSRLEEIEEIQRILATKFRRIHKRDRIAVGNVGQVLKHVRLESPDHRELSVVRERQESDESHCGIHGLRVNEDMLHSELIAQKFQESYSAAAAEDSESGGEGHR